MGQGGEALGGESGVKFIHYFAGGLIALLLAGTVNASALDYPTRPVRWIIGFPAGGAGDIVARIMGQWLSERLGQSVIIENKSGAGTNIAAQALIAAPPDGYTLLWATPANAINATLYEALPFNFLRDTVPVAGLVRFALVLEVNPKVPATTVAQFIAYAKANPDRLSMASFGVGTSSHLAGELLKTMTGTRMVHVPYRGSAPAITDLISGQTQAMFDNLTSSLAQIQSGALRVLAVTTEEPSAMLPGVPTLAETLPGFEASGWSGIVAPRGTPADIVERLHGEVDAGLRDSGIKARLAEVGSTLMPMTPAQFGAFIAAETEKWGKVVKSSGAKAE
jgi:tripartite-type tricarboxylate transporter receptor subunit TctC